LTCSEGENYVIGGCNNVLLLALKQSLNVRPTHYTVPAAYLYNSLQLQTDLYHPIPSTAKDISNQILVNLVSRPTCRRWGVRGGVAIKTLTTFYWLFYFLQFLPVVCACESKIKLSRVQQVWLLNCCPVALDSMSRPCSGGLRDRTLNGSYISLKWPGWQLSDRRQHRSSRTNCPTTWASTSIKCNLSACCFIRVEIASYRNRDFLMKKNRYRIVKKNTES
jgi:hypothetical protein